MDLKRRRMIADLALATLTLFGAALLFIGAMSLPPPRFEPLGSAALPRILGGILVVFAFFIAVSAVRNRNKPIPPANSTGPAPDPKRGALVFGALVLYVFALDVLRVPFLIATPLFVVATGLSIGARSLKNIAAFTALGIFLALFISTVLERLLYVRIG